MEFWQVGNLPHVMRWALLHFSDFGWLRAAPLSTAKKQP
jgi:hypothetical protein